MEVNAYLLTKLDVTGVKNRLSITRVELEQMLQEYAGINCDEQRIICADSCPDPHHALYYAIMTAPRPKLHS